MVTRHLEYKVRETHFFTRDRLGDKPNPVVLAVTEKKERGKKNEIAINESPKAKVPEGKLVVSIMIRQRNKNGGNRERSPSLLRNANPAVLTIQGANPAIRVVNKQEPSTPGRREDMSPHWHLLECIIDKKGMCNKSKK